MVQAQGAKAKIVNRREYTEASVAPSGSPAGTSNSPVMALDFDFKRFVKLLEDMPTTDSPKSEEESENSCDEAQSPRCEISTNLHPAPVVTLSDGEGDSDVHPNSFKMKVSDGNFSKTDIDKSPLKSARDSPMTVSPRVPSYRVSNESYELQCQIRNLEARRAEDAVAFANAKAVWSRKMDELQKELADSINALHDTTNTLHIIASTSAGGNERSFVGDGNDHPFVGYHADSGPQGLRRLCAAIQQQPGLIRAQMPYLAWMPNYPVKSVPNEISHMNPRYEAPIVFPDKMSPVFHHNNSMMVVPQSRSADDCRHPAYNGVPQHANVSIPISSNDCQESFEFRSSKRHRNHAGQSFASPASPVASMIPPSVHAISPIDGKWGTTDGQQGDLRACDAPGLVRVLFVQWNGMAKHARKTIGEAELFLQTASHQLDSNNIIFHCFSRPPGTRGLRARVPMGAMWDTVFSGSPLLARFKYTSRVFTDTCNAKDLRKSSRPSRMHGFHENIFTAHQAVRGACCKETSSEPVLTQH